MAVATLVSLAITAVSMIYQASEKRKAAKKAKEDADARKGFEISVEGVSMALPVVYGRTKIAGARVYHNMATNYRHADSPQPSFNALMTHDQNYPKNTCLFVQQALCHGNIHSIVDCTFDDIDRTKDAYQVGYRVNTFTKGNIADPMMVANFPERASAVFTDVAYASMVFALNRDDPQFGGVPETAFYVEGAETYSVTLVNGVYGLSATKTYSTNPARCLLDYLMSPVYGRGLTLADIDLETFYLGQQICGTIVQQVPAAGRVWSYYNIGTRDLPLYECNLVVDTSKPVRDNIIDILACMGDADLVWSGGLYKLQVQYPKNLGEIRVAGYITDDDLAISPIDVKYPSAAERMNFCSIKFSNEANDFKEDSASWPPKGSNVYNTFLADDNHIPLEKSYTEVGIVSSYHAMAKAEELVRVSRSSVTYGFKLILSGAFYEPGDILFVNSPIANIVNEYLKIQEISVTDESTANVTCVKFDPAQLAWNAKDDEIVPPRNNYDFALEPVLASSIAFQMHPAGSVTESLGTLFWAVPAGNTPVSYQVSVRPTGTIDFVSLGTTNTNSIEIFSLKAGTYEFIVQAVYPLGKMALPSLSAPIVINALAAPKNVKFSPKVTAQLEKSGTVTWDKIPDDRVVEYRIYVYKVGDFDSNFNPIWAQVGTSAINSFVIPALETVDVIIGVTGVTRNGAESDKGLSGTITIVYPKPPTPTNITAAIEGDTKAAVRLNWTRPATRADGTSYNDHMVTVIYKRRPAQTQSWTYVGESSLSTYLDITVDYGVIEYQLKFLSTRGTYGDGSTPFAITTSLFDSADTTPPPAPFNLTAAAMFSNILLDWKIPTYTVGHGHDSTLIYAAEWPADVTTQPSFSEVYLASAVKISDSFVFPTGLGRRWVFWAKTMSVDRGISTAFAGPVVAKTGLVGNADLGEDIIEADNIADNTISNQHMIPGLEGIFYSTATTLPTTNIGNTISWKGVLYKWDTTTTPQKYVKVVNATDFDGQLLAAQIADNAITLTKFASGIEPVTTITTGNLPTTKSTTLINFKGALYKWNGTAYVPNVIADAAITATQIADAALTLAKFASGIEPVTTITTGSLPTTKSTAVINYNGILYKWNGTAYVVNILGDNAVTANVIAANSITTAKIAAGAVNADQIAAGAIVADKIAANAITVDKILANTITGDKIAAQTITASNIAADTITAAQIAAGAINADELAANAVTAVKIAAGAITADKIAANAITAGQIAAGTITSTQIAANTITAANIAANSITAGQIAAGAITASELAAGAIAAGSAAIANGAIRNAQIANAAIDSAKIADASIGTAKLIDASITNAKIAGVIQSNALDVYGRPLWSLNKDGLMELNSTSGTYRRDMRANYDRYWYMATGVLVIEIGELS